MELIYLDNDTLNMPNFTSDFSCTSGTGTITITSTAFSI
jgi:hypothetical protein